MSYTERNSNVKFVNLFRFGIKLKIHPSHKIKLSEKEKSTVNPIHFETGLMQAIKMCYSDLPFHLVPGNEIAGFVSDIRNRNYEKLRGISGMHGEMGISKIKIPNVEIATLPVKQGKNLVVGKTIKDSGILSNFGVTVLAVKRGEKYLTNDSPELKICQDDILYVFGKPESIIKLKSFFILTLNTALR